VSKEGKLTRFSPGQEKTEPLIKAFIERYDNYKAGYKTGGEDIALGEAVWILEAATNYEFRGSKEDIGDFSYDTLLTEVDVYIGSNNEYFISESDAMLLYSDLVAFTSTNVSGENNKLLVGDLETLSTTGNTIEIVFVTTTGKGGFNPMEIGPTDYWYPVLGMGKCSDFIGQNIGKDASSRIREIINSSQAIADYWTDISYSPMIHEIECPCNYDPCFYEGSSNYCIDPTEMQSWLNRAICIVQETVPSGYSRIEAYFDWDVIVSGVTYVHFFQYIKYGIPHTSGGGTK